MSENAYTDGRSGNVIISMMEFDTGTLLDIGTSSEENSTTYGVHNLSVEQLKMLRDTLDEHIAKCERELAEFCGGEFVEDDGDA